MPSSRHTDLLSRLESGWLENPDASLNRTTALKLSKLIELFVPAKRAEKAAVAFSDETRLNFLNPNIVRYTSNSRLAKDRKKFCAVEVATDYLLRHRKDQPASVSRPQIIKSVCIIYCRNSSSGTASIFGQAASLLELLLEGRFRVGRTVVSAENIFFLFVLQRTSSAQIPISDRPHLKAALAMAEGISPTAPRIVVTTNPDRLTRKVEELDTIYAWMQGKGYWYSQGLERDDLHALVPVASSISTNQPEESTLLRTSLQEAMQLAVQHVNYTRIGIRVARLLGCLASEEGGVCRGPFGALAAILHHFLLC